ncbi:MAG: hypothetical protein GX555_13235, partial [Actinomycetales bacterium]|nr:hypothetical protein [Actinomycetales bacterium]
MARYAQVFEASGGGVSGLEARLAAVLADPPVVFEEIAPLPDCPVLVEFVSLAEDAVVQALAVLGVPAGECDLLTDLAQACASVARRGAPAPGQEFFTRTGPATGRGAAGLDLAGAAEAAPTKSGAAGPRVTEPTEADPAGTADPDPTDPAPADPATGEASVGEEAPAVKGRASSLVDALGVLSRAAGRLDRVMISGTRELTAAQGKLLLADKGVTDLDELTPAQKEAWRANAKRRTRTDLEFEMGWGAGEIRDLVALAGMPATTTGPVGSALATGEASWRLVRGFVGAAGHLPTHLAGGVANALFGTDESVAATERLTSDREFTGRPWAHREFYRALDREVAKAEANLDEDERRTKSRAKSLQGTDTWGRMDEDGTGTFGMRCTASQVAAILDRVEGAARRARSNGDGRPLGQIRSAVTATLLLKGIVALPDLPEDPGLITPEQT